MRIQRILVIILFIRKIIVVGVRMTHQGSTLVKTILMLQKHKPYFCFRRWIFAYAKNTLKTFAYKILLAVNNPFRRKHVLMCQNLYVLIHACIKSLIIIYKPCSKNSVVAYKFLKIRILYLFCKNVVSECPIL